MGLRSQVIRESRTVRERIGQRKLRSSRNHFNTWRSEAKIQEGHFHDDSTLQSKLGQLMGLETNIVKSCKTKTDSKILQTNL